VSTIAVGDIQSTFAPTPPIEALRLLLSLMMTLPPPPGSDWVMIIIDISRAHPHSDVLRRVVIELPAEAGMGPEYVAVLLRALYGLRDAAQAFEFKVLACMTIMKHVQGVFTPCVYYAKECHSRVWAHGDDFAVMVPRKYAPTFIEELSKELIVKVRARLGFRDGDDRSIRLLNRLISFVPSTGPEPDMITWEADPRHIELMAHQLGLQLESRAAAAPGLKAKRAVLEGAELEAETQPLYRSVCMREAFLAQDRPDIMFVSKEAARAMARPTRAAHESVKHATRYLIGQRRLVWIWKRQAPRQPLIAKCDADHAGCFTTRRSTSGVMLFHGAHLIKATSTTQGPVALSVGESEFVAAVKAAASVLGMASLAKDWGLDLERVIETDSASTIGTASRRGAGRIRHIETPLLWLQQATSRRQLKIRKIPGVENPANLLTKILERPQLLRELAMAGLVLRSGEHEEALKSQIPTA
jgi:hypothetical protein